MIQIKFKEKEAIAGFDDEIFLYQTALKYNLVEAPEGYYDNNIKGLMIRRQTGLTPDQKEKVYALPNLTPDEKYVVNLIKTEFKEFNEEELYQTFRRMAVGNMEDVTSFMEDVLGY